MSGTILRWALMLSGVVVAVALGVALRLEQPLQAQSPIGTDFFSSSSSSSSAFDTSPHTTTHCYKSIRTHNDDQPRAQCFTVQDGIFTEVATKSSYEVGNEQGYVIPGLWDGHGHLLQYGEFLHSVDLFGSKSLEDVRSRIKSYLDRNPRTGTKDQWLRGVGWDQAAFGRMPTADDLAWDPILKDVYIMLDRVDVHCSWVSQPILDLLPSDIPDIPGGDIIRDPGMGVFCDNAMEVITNIWPKPGPDTKAKQVKSAMAKLNEVGLVGMHDAGATPQNLRLFESLADDRDWTLRVYAMLECEKRNTYCPEVAVKVAREDARLTVRSVKLFADGALGSWGSAMIDPYTDHPWTSGSLLINASSLTSITKLWVSQGYQVNIHAIGDLANRNAIDAMTAALEQECGRAADLKACQAKHRFRIEHSQILHPNDQARILKIGILPSIQPTHATSDMRYAQDRLGSQRLHTEAYRMKSLLPASPILGSDFPVEPPNPFQGIYAAVARRSPHTGLGPGDGSMGFLTPEALSLDEALRGFTTNVAHGAFLDGKAGSIREGAFADWVVLDRPIEEYAVEELRTLKVRETWVGGKRVYSRPT